MGKYDEKGQGIVEYALILTFIAIMLMNALSLSMMHYL